MVSLTNGSFDLGLLFGGTLHQLTTPDLVALGLVQHGYLAAAFGVAPSS
jgi:hypothetical protein